MALHCPRVFRCWSRKYLCDGRTDTLSATNSNTLHSFFVSALHSHRERIFVKDFSDFHSKNI